MISVTYGMGKSLCKVMFDMYQGPIANFLNVLDRNVWIIFVLEGYIKSDFLLAVANVLGNPQNCWEIRIVLFKTCTAFMAAAIMRK
jgi:hypothetical protein